MDRNISQLNKEIAVYYGYDTQSNQLIEECAELIQAINKYRRVKFGGQPVAVDKKATVVENIVEEIADVEIMLEQLKYLLSITTEELNTIKQYKINRIIERMGASCV